MSRTHVEQVLMRMHSEILFMCKNSLGNIDRTAYADRVIEDVTGIEGLASSVVASSVPNAVILNAIRGTRGENLMRFFDDQFHEARLELVEVLVEATKLGRGRSESDHESHRYLQKLYEKSIRKMIKLIGGPKKVKSSFSGNYPALGSLTGMGRYRDDDDDEWFSEDDEDEPFSSYTDYADEYINALREGREPPRPLTYAPKPPPPVFAEDRQDIMDMIDRIQRRIGRQLTSSEMAAIIHEATKDEPSEEVDEGPSWDELVNAVAKIVIAQMTGNQGADETKSPETETVDIGDHEIHLNTDLDSFLEKSEKDVTPENGEVKTEEEKPAEIISKEEFAEKLPDAIRDYNRKKETDAAKPPEDSLPMPSFIAPSGAQVTVNTKPTPTFKAEPTPPKLTGIERVKPEVDPESITTKELIQKANGVVPEEKESSEDDSESNQTPPVDQAGGDESEDEETDEEENVLTVLDSIRGDATYLDIVKNFIESSGTASFCDHRLSLFPSREEGYLFDLEAQTLIDGDPQDFNVLHLNAINSRACGIIGDELHIPPERINLSSEILAIGDQSVEGEVSTFSELVGQNPVLVQHGITLAEIDATRDMICDRSMVLWHLYGIEPDVRYYWHIDTGELYILIAAKEPSEGDCHDADALGAFYSNAKQVFQSKLNADIIVMTEENPDMEHSFIGLVQSKMDSELVSKMLEQPLETAKTSLAERFTTDYGINPGELELTLKVTKCGTSDGACLDLQFVASYPKDSLGVDGESEMDRSFDYIFSVNKAFEFLLKILSPSMSVDSYLILREREPEIDENSIPDDLEESQTNAFGL